MSEWSEPVGARDQTLMLYEATRDASGDTESIRRSEDGTAVPIDPDNQQFCDFLTWAAESPNRTSHQWVMDYGLPPDGRFFGEVEPLISECKRRGILLATDGRTIQIDRDLDIELSHFKLSPGRPVPKRPVWRFFAITRAKAASVGIEAEAIHTWVSEGLLERLFEELQKPDSDTRRVSAWAVEKTFLFVDVSDFSRHLAVHQALIINSLISTAAGDFSQPLHWIGAADDLEASLCIGDGYIFVFRHPGYATVFAARLAARIETMMAKRSLPVEFHFRMGIHTGPVFRFWDPGRQGWNYIGDGINGGQRVLSAIGKDTDDVVFVSDRVRQCIVAGPPESIPYKVKWKSDFPHEGILAQLQNRGRRADKHGNLWRVYEVNHTAVAKLQ
jgi:class 3 adenylate cyclase